MVYSNPLIPISLGPLGSIIPYTTPPTHFFVIPQMGEEKPSTRIRLEGRLVVWMKANCNQMVGGLLKGTKQEKSHTKLTDCLTVKTALS